MEEPSYLFQTMVLSKLYSKEVGNCNLLLANATMVASYRWVTRRRACRDRDLYHNHICRLDRSNYSSNWYIGKNHLDNNNNMYSYTIFENKSTKHENNEPDFTYQNNRLNKCI